MSLPLLLLGSFLVGSIPFGWLLHRLVSGGDLRERGSGNIGATNVARSHGLTAGVIILGLDAAKGVVPVLGARALGLPPVAAIGAGTAAILGHVFCPWLGLRGGKGVATALGVVLAGEPWAGLPAAGAFLMVVMATGYVSLGSMVGALLVPLSALVLARPAGEIGLWTAVALLVLWRHRDNLGRLRDGSEPRFGRRRAREEGR